MNNLTILDLKVIENLKNLSKFGKIQLVEKFLDDIENSGIDKLAMDQKIKYDSLKNWFNIEAKKMRYI